VSGQVWRANSRTVSHEPGAVLACAPRQERVGCEL
jgi:hypothetical protein